mmetsp:Transcript_31899/g.69797  ORF Transcript_31899/g.69797 Transcript_31899/m.69797 type:complete len:287 (-) Transcript_31899:40-900(-)
MCFSRSRNHDHLSLAFSSDHELLFDVNSARSALAWRSRLHAGGQLLLKQIVVVVVVVGVVRVHVRRRRLLLALVRHLAVRHVAPPCGLVRFVDRVEGGDGAAAGRSRRDRAVCVRRLGVVSELGGRLAVGIAAEGALGSPRRVAARARAAHAARARHRAAPLGRRTAGGALSSVRRARRRQMRRTERSEVHLLRRRECRFNLRVHLALRVEVRGFTLERSRAAVHRRGARGGRARGGRDGGARRLALDDGRRRCAWRRPRSRLRSRRRTSRRRSSRRHSRKSRRCK